MSENVVAGLIEVEAFCLKMFHTCKKLTTLMGSDKRLGFWRLFAILYPVTIFVSLVLDWNTFLDTWKGTLGSRIAYTLGFLLSALLTTAFETASCLVFFRFFPGTLFEHDGGSNE